MAKKAAQNGTGSWADIDKVIPLPDNAKLHAEGAIGASIDRWGFLEPLVINLTTGHLLGGHGRVDVLRSMRIRGEQPLQGVKFSGKRWLASANYVRIPASEEYEASVALNRTSEIGGWDMALVASRLQHSPPELLALTGFALGELPITGSDPAQGPGLKLSERFLVPPFSVLDARQGYWKDRKAEWLALGIRSAVGRGENLLKMSETVLEPDPAKRAQKQRARALAQDMVKGEGGIPADGLGTGKRNRLTPGGGGGGAWLEPQEGAGTSIFDPVLCELVYQWFSWKGASVFDPFAGGSVRGIVAAVLGRKYVGLDISAGQLEANREQAKLLVPRSAVKWIEASAVDAASAVSGPFDLLFSCPPYGDLERYSDDPRDLSTMSYPDFLKAYRESIRAAASLLANDRFACFVVGDIRDKRGSYRNFVGHTVSAFEDAGLSLYNEAILVTPVGSLSIRVGRQFPASRKLGKTHQNVLVFIKGDARAAVKACGEVEIPPLDAEVAAAVE